MNRKLKIVGASTAGLAVITVGATSFAHNAPTTVSSHPSHAHPGHHPKHPQTMGRAGVVKQVGSSTITVAFHHHKKTVDRTISTSGLTIRAAAYPSSLSIVKAGEHVRVMGGKGHAMVVVMPVAGGTLTQSGSSWSVHTKKSATLSLSNGSPTFYGMTSWSANTPVLVFGTRQGTTINEVAVAARPHTYRGTVTNNSNGTLTIKTAHGTFTYSPTALPSGMLNHLKSLKVGAHMAVTVAPNNQVVMIRPLHVHPHKGPKYGMLHTVTAGTISQVSSNSMTLTTAYGSSTVNLTSQTVKVLWAKHPGATVGQLTKGLKVVVHKAPHANRVLVRVIR